jgi:hypothetical protein
MQISSNVSVSRISTGINLKFKTHSLLKYFTIVSISNQTGSVPGTTQFL